MIDRPKRGRAAASTPASLLARRRAGHRSKGQTLVEFALVFPFFLVILFGVIEFAFILNALLSLGFASHEAALAAAEGGNSTSADCSVLKAVQRSFDAPTDKTQITEIRIFKANTSTGAPLGPAQVYDRSGTTPCDGPNNTTVTLPWALISSSYPPDARCNILLGCGNSSPTVDTIGVAITYIYKGHTPMSAVLPNSSSGFTMMKSSAMRMEPVL
jgi:Flp pilus assembly protein TadG